MARTSARQAPAMLGSRRDAVAVGSDRAADRGNKPGRSRAPSTERRVAALALAAVVLCATFGYGVLALRSPSPWIIPDELIYSELGRSLGAGELPSIRGETTFSWGLGYPLLQAPVWALFDDVTTAYAVLKAWNALLLSLTAVPAYLLARRFLDRSSALLVSALTVAVPSMFYAGTLMTEVAVYPVFTLASFAMVVALERPRAMRQLTAIAALGLAFSVKSLAVALVATYVVAIPLHGWLETRDQSLWRARMRGYMPTAIVAVGGIVVLVAVLAAAGRPPWTVLGEYAVVVRDVELGAIPRWVVAHLAALDIYLAVIPLVATTLVVASGFRIAGDREQRLFAAVTAPLFFFVLVAVGSFASVPFLEEHLYPENVTRLQERSLFWVTPLFLIGTLLWLRDRPGGKRAAVAAVAIAVALPVAIASDTLARTPNFQAFALDPWRRLSDDASWPYVSLAVTGLLGALFLVARARGLRAVVFLTPVVYWFLVVGVLAHFSTREVSQFAHAAAWGDDATWIDVAVGRDATVDVLWSERPGEPFVDLEPRHYVVLIGEFFNESVGRLYELGSPMPYGLPSTPVRLRDGTVVLDDGRALAVAPFVLAPCHVHVVGAVVATDVATGARVYRPRLPLRAEVEAPGSCAGRGR